MICNKMNGTNIPHRITSGTPVCFWTPTNPVSSICDKMKETIEMLPDKINYIKESMCVDFLMDKKEKLAKIVITLEEIINKRQKEKINNNM